MMQRPPISWIAGFVLFWYRFIVGDDWTIAAAVGVGLAITAVLLSRGVSIYWLMPVIVIGVVGFDLERTSRKTRRRSQQTAAGRAEGAPPDAAAG